MRRLYVLGDSFSTPFDHMGDFRENYVKWKGYTPKFWGVILAEELNLDLTTYGSIGDNEDILDKIIDIIDTLKPDDILCIGWTSLLRFRLVKNDKWWCVFPNMIPDTKIISTQTVGEIVVNREHKLYKEALYNRIKLINKALPDNLIINWSWEDRHQFPFQTIHDETTGEINDHHWSEKGNQQFAKWLVDKINVNENVTLI
jgi:hypothetical protein